MNYVVVGSGALVVAVGVLFLYLFRRLTAPARNRQPSLEWCNQFSMARYRPMERLFSEEDDRFLASQPGYSPGLSKRLKAARRRIFRQYLRCLGRDFDRLHAAARFLSVHAPQDRPDLAVALFRQKLLFRQALLMVHGRLALQAVGIGTVEISRLIQALEGMGTQFRQLAAVPRPSAG